MREEVIREVVTRAMMEPGFLQQFLTQPGPILSQYTLRADELEALQVQLGASGSGVLEQRISASFVKRMTDTPDWCKDSTCGCKCCAPARDCKVCAGDEEP